MEGIRSFIAIELPEEVRKVLAHLEAQLKKGKHSGVKWVDPYSIHLTLKFLGDIAADKTGDITRTIEKSSQGIPPFRLEVKELGVFPNFKRVRVVWVGMSGEVERLIQFQKRLESELVPLGFAPESRPFTPHLTLARVREGGSPAEQQNFGQLIADTKFETVCNFTADSVSLMRSQLTSQGAIYSRISSVKLK
jgi:2'-5' RNA ligase